MALSNEDLLAISTILDKKLDPLKKNVRSIELQLKNRIEPRIQNIESCYTTTYDTYRARTDLIDSMQMDLDNLKIVVSEHSRKLQGQTPK